MPQIGWFEILIIVSLAIIIIGPKDFPIMLKKVGSWIGSAKRYVSNVQNEVSSLGNEDFSTDKKKEEKVENNDTNQMEPNCNKRTGTLQMNSRTPRGNENEGARFSSSSPLLPLEERRDDPSEGSSSLVTRPHILCNASCC